jgi:hypothetical protein
MNNQEIQKNDNAGKTKLTAVTIGHGTQRHQFFVRLKHDSKGKAILPSETLNQILSSLRRGDTFTVG